MQPFSIRAVPTIRFRERLLHNRFLPTLFLFLLWIAFMTPVTYAQQAIAEASNANAANTLFLPMIAGSGTGTTASNFTPTTSTTLPSGVYTFDTFTIPAGITITVSGPVTITTTGNATIDGSLVGDCQAIHLQSQGALQIIGAVDNRCQDPNAPTPGTLTLYGNGAMQIGTVEKAALIESSGDITVSNDPTLPAWEFDLLPEQRSVEPLPPVCSAAADSLWETALPDSPAAIRFTANALDPDGGPVTYTWDFGDGTSADHGADLLHYYDVAGVHTVTLTASDNDGQSCQATLGITIDDGDAETLSIQPAVQMQPVELAAATGDEITFAAAAFDAQSEPLTYTWAFGDGGGANLITGAHSYASPGRYPVTLTVTDAEGNSRQATASVYIYPAEATAATVNAPLAICPPLNPPGSILVNQGNVFNPLPAGPGRDGRNITHIWRGNVIINRGVQIRGQDGGNGLARVGIGTMRGQRGGNGGGVRFFVHGKLTVCGGVTLAAGDGGDGGKATATANPGGNAYAYGGKGGRAGSHALFVATQSITFEEPGITVDGGDGGDGGDGAATGGNGQDRCNSAQNGGAGYAYGGDGGLASKAAIAQGQIIGTLNVTLTGGQGGDGGAATASGGKGGNATCPGMANGGQAGRGYARGGLGGDAHLTGRWRLYRIGPGAFTAGNGGLATATGGLGGNGVATPLGACAPATATGGHGGPAWAQGGHGGRGRINGFGRWGDATGGKGGNATATGGDCANCGNGGAATATAGKGGNAQARDGRPLLIGSTATAGDGGVATAKGGRGGDCPTCPGGKGGDGGVAAATGGDGGQAASPGVKTGGNGGLGDATGGEGGNGADCCGPPHLPGGNGGNGGAATSMAGKGGNPGGIAGGNATSGGNGGNGGDGEGPGAGGAGGIGTGIPVDIFDGFPGVQGEHCPKPTPTITVTVPTDPTPPPNETPTPQPTTTPTPVATVITGVDVRPSVTRTTPMQPVALIAKLIGANGQVVDAPSFFDVFFEVTFAEQPTGQRLPAQYVGQGCYQLILPLEQVGIYHITAVAARREEGPIQQSQPVLIEVVAPAGASG